MSIRRSRKRKREESAEDVDMENNDQQTANNGELETPTTPTPDANGEEIVTDAMQEKEQMVWEAFREEYIESVEQLPLSLHRNFTLMRELDAHAMSTQSKFVPALLQYITKRQEIEHMRLQRLRVTSDSNADDATCSDGNPTTTQGRDNEAKSGPLAQDKGRPNGHGEAHANGIAGSRSTPSVRSSEGPSLVRGGRRDRSASDVPSFSARVTPNGASESEVGPSNRIRRTDELLSYVSSLIGEAMRTCEEKLALAQATYDSVDRHVRLLDQAIIEQESRLPPELRSRGMFSLPNFDQQVVSSPHGVFVPQPASGLDGLQVLAAVAQEDANTLPVEQGERTSSRGSKKGHRRKGSESSRQKNLATEIISVVEAPKSASTGVALAQDNIATASFTGMPVDPNEPRYCYCNNVSFGEMIGCDNNNCEKEWFHLECAGLTEAPKGRTKWYCNDCKDKRERSDGGSSRRRGR